MPLIGEMVAANFTTAELDQKISEKLGEKYLEHPDVSVGIKESSTARVVTVDGAVAQAGSFPVDRADDADPGGRACQGTREDSNPRRVAVFRTIGGQRQAAAFDLTEIRRGQSPTRKFIPGDIVVVDGSSIKATQKQIFQTVPLLAMFGPF